jgi:hypothetical protein
MQHLDKVKVGGTGKLPCLLDNKPTSIRKTTVIILSRQIPPNYSITKRQSKNIHSSKEIIYTLI